VEHRRRGVAGDPPAAPNCCTYSRPFVRAVKEERAPDLDSEPLLDIGFVEEQPPPATSHG